MKKIEEYNKNKNDKKAKIDYDYELIVHDLIDWYGINDKVNFCILAHNWSRGKLDKNKIIKEYNKQKNKQQ